jgi:hypothetical protein
MAPARPGLMAAAGLARNGPEQKVTLNIEMCVWVE